MDLIVHDVDVAGRVGFHIVEEVFGLISLVSNGGRWTGGHCQPGALEQSLAFSASRKRGTGVGFRSGLDD